MRHSAQHFIIDRQQITPITEQLFTVNGQFDAAADAMFDLHDQLRTMYTTELAEAKRLGIDLDELNDYYIGYSHRKPEFAKGSAMQRYLDNKYRELDKKKLIPAKANFMIARDDVLRNFPGGTRKLNEATMDPMVTAIKHQPDVAKKLWSQQIGVYDEL
ncbi:MAG: hypothetical protein EBT13_17100, partial [Rhodobacteraceae bacterium]|nr:hypothetical protein [Paracoccaceae bacterium]